MASIAPSTARSCYKQTALDTAYKLLSKVYPTLYDDRPTRETPVNQEHRVLKRNASTWMRIGASSIELVRIDVYTELHYVPPAASLPGIMTPGSRGRLPVF